MMKLLYYPHAPYSRKVLLAAYERGVDFEPVIYLPWEKESKQALKAMHPLGTVPLLADGDEVFIESSIIVEHFDLVGTRGAPLLPRDAREALAVRAWDKFGDSHLMGPTAYLAWATRKPADQQNTDKIKAQRTTLETALGIADKRLAASTFLAGEAFTMADLSPVSAISCQLVDGTLKNLDAWPNVNRWHRAVLERPSFVRILEECRTVALPPGF